MIRKRLLIVGDSITLGAADVRGSEIIARVRTSYVDLLRQSLPDVQFHIEADAHRNTASVREKFAAMLQHHQPDVVLLMLGGSDADLDWRRFVMSEGAVIRHRVPIDRYEKNLRHLAQLAVNSKIEPILTDMNNHCLALRGRYVSTAAGRDVMPWIERGGGQAESDRFLETYRAVAAAVAGEMDLEIAQFGVALSAHKAVDVLSEDGAHPNDAGHALIAQTLSPILTRVLARCSHQASQSAA